MQSNRQNEQRPQKGQTEQRDEVSVVKPIVYILIKDKTHHIYRSRFVDVLLFFMFVSTTVQQVSKLRSQFKQTTELYYRSQLKYQTQIQHEPPRAKNVFMSNTMM